MVLLLVFNRCRLQVTHCYDGVTADFVMSPADVVKHHCGRWMITLGFIVQICFSHLIFPVSDSTQVGCCIIVHLDSCLCVEFHLNNQEFIHCQFEVCLQNCKTQLVALSWLSLHPHGMSSHWTDFCEILYLSVFFKTCQENSSFLKIWQDNRYFTWCPIYIYDHNVPSSSHILCSITFFLNHAFYGIIRKNIVEVARPQMTIWCMCHTCWIPKATNTHSEYVILIAFPLQQWLHKCSSMLRFMHTACLV